MDFNQVKKAFSMREVGAVNYSPLTLAYLGDCVYELAIRTIIVNRGNQPVNILNKEGSNLAKAATQAKIIHILEAELTPQEQAAYKRGRNAKSPTMAKNATVADYRAATGFEALLGYLYMEQQEERLLHILQRSFQIAGVLKEEKEEV